MKKKLERRLTIPRDAVLNRFSNNKMCNELANAIIFKAKLNGYIEKLSDKLFKE